LNYRTLVAFKLQKIKATANFFNASYLSLLLSSSLYFLGMLLLGIDRHWSFKTSINDTGAFDQAIWSILNRGTPIVSIGSSAPYHWFAVHFHPWLYLFAPLYKIYPSPEWLIFAQALSVASAVLPIYKIALKLNYTDWQAFYWSFGFLLNPFVLSAAQWDFHPVAVAAPFIAWSIYFLLANDFKKLLFCVLSILLCQEQFGILTLCLGISHYCVNKNAKQSLVLIAIGAFYTLILFLYVFPTFSPVGTHIMMSAEHKEANRYHWLGSTLFGIIAHLLSSPLEIIKKCLFEMGGFQYLMFLLLPYGLFIPLLGFDILLIGAADFAANALSLLDLQRSMNSYHSVALIPIIIVAAMRGFNYYCRAVPGRIRNLTAVFAIFTSLLFFSFCLPHLFGQNSFWKLKLAVTKQNELSEIQKRIPAEASLSAQANIGAHFSQLESIHVFPKKIPEADAVILRLEDPDDSLKENIIRFGHYMLMEPKDYLAAVRCVLDSGAYRIGYFNPPWLLFLKSTDAKPATQRPLLAAYLDHLEQRWNLEPPQSTSHNCPWKP